MRALLIVAHGSRRAESNDEVKSLTDGIRTRIESSTHSNFDFIHCAFLELADPLIPVGLLECVNWGAKEVVVLPYFLSAGRHVTEDIPKIVQQVAVTMPSVNIVIAPYLGSAIGLSDLLLDLAK